MSCLFSACGNLCAFLSCISDSKNVISKLVPCMKPKETKPIYKEEIYKITFLDHTIVKFEKIEENISQD